MKKVFLLTMVAMFVFCATSCKKEGVYKPGKKVEQILRSSDNNPEPTPDETWSWDGKLLKSITYHWLSTEDALVQELFTYDGKRLVSSDIEGASHTEYIYDGRKLARIVSEKSVDGYGKYTDIYEFEHDGKKISKIINTMTITVADAPDACVSPLRMFLPYGVCQQIEADNQRDAAAIQKSGAKVEIIITRNYNLTWEGDNVTKIEGECYQSGLELPSYTYVRTFAYDNKRNPFAGLYTGTEFIYDEADNAFGANNITADKEVITRANGQINTDAYTYSYTYDDDNYPIAYTSTRDSSQQSKKYFTIKYLK